MSGARVALVVANDEYDDPGLRRLVAPAQDAAALAEVLADPAVGGFDVRVLRNESAQEIRVAVEDFFADRTPEDLLLLHFSCHGVKNASGELFLAMADTRPTRLASTAVAADFVNRQMADSRAQRIALFLDCCYGGAFPRGMVVRAGTEAQVLDAFAGQADVGGGRGRVVVTASSAMEYAFEGGHLATGSPPEPSVFTGAVVDGLTTGDADRDGDGWVGLTELVGFVTDRVHRATPNQNPQMWTFGSQGELLIARSRVRRITPAPLAPELVDAMESPLPAARFGVVDYLRERLYDEDLAQAYAAWQALHEMVDDDSRKVSEAAVEAIAVAVPTATPAELVLGPAGAAEVRLAGPPIALTAVASAAGGWLKVEQDGASIRVRAGDPATAEATSLILTGPTGELRIPVRLTTSDAESKPPPPPTAPPPTAPPPTEPPPTEPPPTEPVRPHVEPTAASSTPGWRLIAVLVVGAVLLVLVNWPGTADSRKLWYDPDPTGWYLYRTWSDPALLASVGALAASLAARWAGAVALGVVAGCVVSLLEDGIVVLGGGISADETTAWAITTGICLLMVFALMTAARRQAWPLYPVPPAPAALVGTGGVLLVVGLSITDSSGYSLLTVTPLFLLKALVAVALAWSALAAVEARMRSWLTTAAVTLAVLGTIGAVPTWTRGHSVPVFVFYLAGAVLLTAGVLIPGPRLRSRP